MSEWKAVSLLAVVLVGTVQSTSRCHARKKDGSVCPRSTKVEIKFKPYYEIYFDKNGSTKSLYPRILAQASSQCCNSSSLDFISINSTEDIEELIKDESCDKEDHNQTNLTFFFPVFIQEGKKVAFDEEYQFVQLMKSSGPAVVMLKSEKGKMRVTASVAIRESWPLFALIISLSSTVGLLAWLMDHSKNPSQFPSWFYKGAWEGFWWAMVTITTVGYGDKAPVAFFSRVLSIVWMLCGAIILSLFTANVTSVLTSNQMDDTKNLIGRRIAVLNSKHYFESTLNVGGTIEEFNSQEEMLTKLMEKKVDRVLAPNYLDIIRLEENNPMMDLLTIVDVIHEPFLTGFALANKDTREDQPFLTCLKREVKRLKNVSSTNDQVPPSSEDFIHRTTMLYHDDIIRIIYYNLIAIGMIAGVGFFLDLIRCLRLKSKKTLNNDEDIEMGRLDANV